MSLGIIFHIFVPKKVKYCFGFVPSQREIT